MLLLPLVGFIIYLIYSAAKTGDWKRATLPIAYIFEVIIIGVMVLVPLIYTRGPAQGTVDDLPGGSSASTAASASAGGRCSRSQIIHRVSVEDVMRAPTVIPKTIAQVKDEPEPPPNAGVGVVGGVPGGVPGGQMGGVLGGVIGGALSAAAPPPPPPPQAANPQAHPGGRPGGIGEG